MEFDEIKNYLKNLDLESLTYDQVNFLYYKFIELSEDCKGASELIELRQEESILKSQKPNASKTNKYVSSMLEYDIKDTSPFRFVQ
jgi:hypothetical protein